MYCKNCEKEFEKGKFCPKCGEKLIDYDEYEDEYEEKIIEDDDGMDYDENVEQVKQKAMDAAKTYGGIAMNFGKALANYAKKATDEFLENSQNINLQKNAENKKEKVVNSENNIKKQENINEDYDALKKKLQVLKEMKDEGLLCTEEYEEKRAGILGKKKERENLIPKIVDSIKGKQKIRKCYCCGEILDAFALKCPVCGYEIAETQQSDAMQKFQEELRRIDHLKYETEEAKFFGLSFKVGKDSHDILLTKVDYIKNYVVPRTKEDLFEFMILAKSNIELKLFEKIGIFGDKYHGLNPVDFENRLILSKAWVSMVQQIYDKAKVVFHNDDKVYKEIEKIYNDIYCVIK